MATAASTPMIATTIINSIRVKPCCARLFDFLICLLLRIVYLKPTAALGRPVSTRVAPPSVHGAAIAP